MCTISTASIALLLIAPQFCNAQSNGPAIEELNWAAVVTATEATFIFPPSSETTWKWHSKDTKNNAQEYAWNVAVGDETSGYHLGHHCSTTKRLAKALAACPIC